MTAEQQAMAEAFEDIGEVFFYADALGATSEGRVYLRLLAETAHNALAYALAHC